jgi:hypothetical protein
MSVHESSSVEVQTMDRPPPIRLSAAATAPSSKRARIRSAGVVWSVR